LQVAVCFPLFIATIPGFVNAPIHSPSLAGYLDDPYIEDRRYFLETFKKQEIKRFGTTRLSDLLESSCTRQFFQLSLDYASVKHQFSRLHCPRTRQTMEDALVQLELFLVREGTYSGNAAVLETMQKIKDFIENL